NPSTGFTWSVAANAPSILAPAGDPRFEPPPTPRPGAGSFQTLDFRVAGSGAALLQLVYRRPSEKDAPPARTWSVFVATAALRRAVAAAALRSPPPRPGSGGAAPRPPRAARAR